MLSLESSMNARDTLGGTSSKQTQTQINELMGFVAQRLKESNG